MNRRKLFAALSLIVFAGLIFFSSCNKSNPSEPLEPISVVTPDSLIEQVLAPDTQALKIQFTTDRPINWILGLCDVDTFIDSANYAATYPDTVFFKNLQTANPRVNLYTYTGTYIVPNNLPPFTVINFKISFQAGDASPVYGQNYPVGVVGATKKITLNVR